MELLVSSSFETIKLLLISAFIINKYAFQLIISALVINSYGELALSSL